MVGFLKFLDGGSSLINVIICRYREYTSGTPSYGRYDPLIGTPGSPPVGGISFPPGMFDRYVSGVRLRCISDHYDVAF